MSSSTASRRAAVFAVGNELTEGKVVDTNSAFLAGRLMSWGFDIIEHCTLPDRAELIQKAFKQAVDRDLDLVVITGGLGPTVDDMTKECLAASFERPLELDDRAWEMLKERFRAYGKEPTENNRKQALIPAGARPFYNSCGTAPGLGMEVAGTHFCIMPGIPREMKAMTEESLEPYVRTVLGLESGNEQRVFKTFGIGESDLGNRLEDLMARDRNPRIDLTVQDGIITIKLAAASGTAPESIEDDCRVIWDRVGERIWSDRDEDLGMHLIRVLTEKGQTLALAESCTGGLAAAGLVAVPGCSQVLREGVVAYANEAKINRLGVRPETLEAHGAVSEAVALEMARGIRQHSGASIGAAVTGIAGPGGGTDDKPVGTVWFAVAAEGYMRTYTRVFPGSREYVSRRSVTQLLWMIREAAKES